MLNFFKKLGVGSKVVILATILAAIFLGTSFSFLLINARKNLTESAINSAKVTVNNEKEKIDVILKDLQETVLAISKTPPFQGIIRVRDSDGFDDQDQSTLEQWRSRLEQIFVAQMNSTGLYYQMRYLDENGQEIVRVNYEDGAAYPVPLEGLQNKYDTDYFQEASRLDNNEVYVSDINLNREGESREISLPHVGVVRYATPIYSENDRTFRGIFIINVFSDEIIKRASSFDSTTSQTFVVQKDGFFIIHPDETKQWGGPNDLNTGYSAQQEFGDEINFFDEEGFYFDEENFIVFSVSNPDQNNDQRQWVIIEKISPDLLFASINRLVFNTALIGFVTFILLFFLFFFVIRRLIKPLGDLSVAVESVSKGDFSKILEVNSGDEIGQVASGFNSMTKKLQDSYTNLESQVEEKTKQLTDQVKELEKTRSATLNILEDVAEEREKFEGIFSVSAVGIALVSTEGEWLDVNSALMNIIGYSKDELLNLTFQDITHPDDLNKDLDNVKKMLSGEIRNYQMEKRYIHKKGYIIWVLLTVSAVRNSDDSVKYFVSQILDISKQKEIDKAKSEFVSLASHQLRTPLSSIKWYSEMLLNGDAGKLNQQQREYLDEIYVGNERMVELVNALLNVSRIDLGTFIVEPKDTDVVTVLQEELDVFKHIVSTKKLKVNTKFDKIGTTYSDQKMLRIIFQNLISNAIKYTPEKGEVNITLENQSPEFMKFSVKDSGYGIPKDQQDKIFSKLFRADNVRQLDTDGTGLGLYILKSIVDNIGGKVGFTSEENKGTTFEVVIPKKMKEKAGKRKLS